MPGRYGSAPGGGYRFGFNGKENDGETGTQDYGLRIYNPSLGKFLSLDPLFKGFPWNSPYSFAENDVIRCVDLDGGEKKDVLLKAAAVETSQSVINVVKAKELFKNNPVMWRELIDDYKYATNFHAAFRSRDRWLSAYGLSRYMGGKGGYDLITYDMLSDKSLCVKSQSKVIYEESKTDVTEFAKNNKPGKYLQTFSHVVNYEQSAAVTYDFGTAFGSFQILAESTYLIDVKADGTFNIESGIIRYNFRDTYRWHPGRNFLVNHQKIYDLKYLGAKNFSWRAYYFTIVSGGSEGMERTTFEDDNTPHSYPDPKDYYGKEEKLIYDFRKDE